MRDSSKALTFESPTSRVISRNPLVGDPSEAEHVYVGTSRGKNAGEGLFAKRDIKVRNYVTLGQGFFHRFCGFKNNRISETLSLGEKSLSLAKNPFIFMGEIWNFP